MNPMISRGLWIPDPNFRFGTDAWSVESGLTIVARPSHIGSGQSLRIELDSEAFGHTLQSDYSPFGVGAGPFLGGADQLNFQVWAVVKTENVPSNNTAELIRARIVALSSSGSLVGRNGTTDYFDDTDGNNFRYSDDWTVIVCNVQLDTVGAGGGTALTDAARWFKLQLEFQDESTGASDPYLHVAWVGISMPIDVTTPGDYFTSFYASDCQLGTQASPLGVGGLVRNWSMPWPTMDSADKEVLDECIAWNSRVPRSDALSFNDGSVQELTNNGDQQPLIVVIDREDYKGGMYCNLSSPSFNPGAVGYWPSSGAKHATNLTLIEQDRQRV